MGDPFVALTGHSVAHRIQPVLSIDFFAILNFICAYNETFLVLILFFKPGMSEYELNSIVFI